MTYYTFRFYILLNTPKDWGRWMKTINMLCDITVYDAAIAMADD